MSHHSESAKKIRRLIDREVWVREKLKADMEFNRLPPWERETLEGDRMNDGSDSQEYDNEEYENVRV